MEHDAVNLTLFRVQQDRATSAAGVVHRMLACDQRGRRVQHDAGCRGLHHSEGNLTRHSAGNQHISDEPQMKKMSIKRHSHQLAFSLFGHPAPRTRRR
jgi:hypothetical protein